MKSYNFRKIKENKQWFKSLTPATVILYFSDFMSLLEDFKDDPLLVDGKTVIIITRQESLNNITFKTSPQFPKAKIASMASIDNEIKIKKEFLFYKNIEPVLNEHENDLLISFLEK